MAHFCFIASVSCSFNSVPFNLMCKTSITSPSPHDNSRSPVSADPVKLSIEQHKIRVGLGRACAVAISLQILFKNGGGFFYVLTRPRIR